jgi:hypothetical protein
VNSSVGDTKSHSIEAILGIKVGDLNLGWGTTLIAHLQVGEQVLDLGVYRAGDGLHAEEHLLEELEAYWDEYAEKEVKNVIVIKITRSPCRETSHNCSRQLATFISDRQQEGWSVSLDLNLMTLHGGTSKKSSRPLNQASFLGLKKLVALDSVTLRAWDVLEILKEKRSDVQIDANVQATLERRIRELKNVLDEIDEINQQGQDKMVDL